MDAQRLTEARSEIQRAKTFRRKPKKWATDALGSSAVMTVEEAQERVRAAAFGRGNTSDGSLAEAHRVVAGVASAAKRLDVAEAAIEAAVATKLCLDPRAARLHARSERMAVEGMADGAEKAADLLEGRLRDLTARIR